MAACCEGGEVAAEGESEKIERRKGNWRRERSRVEARERAEVGAVDGGGLEMLELTVGEAQARR
jgi:hypothetical protein